MLDVLYKNNQLIVFNKPAGIPVVADKTGDVSFQEQAEAYCRHPLHAAHRLDRPVSGILLFAKSKSGLAALSAQLQARTVDKEYLAVVEQLPAEPEGVLKHYLQKIERKNISKAFVEAQPGADYAELHYKVLSSGERYHLLHIRLITGRHHQIRAQLAAIGCIIKGDVKYGARRGNPDRSICLHAWRIAFDHPVSGERVDVEAPPPSDALWNALLAAAPQTR